MRMFALLVLLALGVGAVIAPDLALQVFFRGGFLLGGIAIALALRPADDVAQTPTLPTATARVVS